MTQKCRGAGISGSILHSFDSHVEDMFLHMTGYKDHVSLPTLSSSDQRCIGYACTRSHLLVVLQALVWLTILAQSITTEVGSTLGVLATSA